MFFDEFGTRFNFIAVDYLVYTHEIIGTIEESLPIPLIITCILGGGLFFTKFCFIRIKAFSNINSTAFLSRLKWFIIQLLLLIVVSTYNQVSKNDNPYIEELGKNGLFKLFSAFNNNALDYLTFYSKISDKNALDIVRSSIIQPDQSFINNDNIDRIQLGAPSAKKVNVVLIVVESLSAEFMQSFGNTKQITPFLDNLAQESILFTKL